MDPEASYGAATSELVWAEQTSRRLLEPLGARWRHTVGVADRARVVGRALAQREAELLIAAACLHDIGYAPGLAQTGFHAVDGAQFVRSAGHERLAGLVAHHSGSRAEAEERDLAGELSEFKDERSMVSRALTYCDLTTDAEGRSVEAPDRLADIRERYGSGSPEARALDHSGSALLDDVRIVEKMLEDHAVQWRTQAGNGPEGRR
jgi:hypothetical protein